MTIGGVPHTQLDELDPAQRLMENRRIKGQHLRGALRCHPWLGGWRKFHIFPMCLGHFPSELNLHLWMSHIFPMLFR